MKKLLLSVAVLLTVGLGSCASSSAFVGTKSGYAVLRGRITKVENMSAGNVQRFGDGVAVTINQPGCRVSMSFGEQQLSKVMELDSGAIVVYGSDTDYVLQVAPGTPTR